MRLSWSNLQALLVEAKFPIVKVLVAGEYLKEAVLILHPVIISLSD